jgi:hypothetical protein
MSLLHIGKLEEALIKLVQKCENLASHNKQLEESTHKSQFRIDQLITENAVLAKCRERTSRFGYSQQEIGSETSNLSYSLYFIISEP